MMQNRKKQEKLQGQRRQLEVYNLAGKHLGGRRMLEYDDNELARIHYPKRKTANATELTNERNVQHLQESYE